MVYLPATTLAFIDQMEMSGTAFLVEPFNKRSAQMHASVGAAALTSCSYLVVIFALGNFASAYSEVLTFLNEGALL